MPMNGKSTEQVKQEMSVIKNDIVNKLGKDVSFIDSIIDGADKSIAIKGDKIGVWYLGESLKMMSEADLVFFAEGFKEARGCMTEYKVAVSYGMYVIEQKPTQ